MPNPPAQAFLSYTRSDDQYFGGYITAFRKVLENAVHVVTGERTFHIFQDIEGIIVGEPFQRKIDEVIHQSSFFVPMLSPTFFNSEPCRNEVGQFLKHEKDLGRDDLILPIYFVSSAKAEKEEQRRNDPVMSELFKRQLVDWRDKRTLPLEEPSGREGILALAGQVAQAIERVQTLQPSNEPRRDQVLPSDPRLDTGVRAKPDKIDTQTVLWVDDHPENNVWEQRALQSYGVHFVIAQDTAQAQQLLHTGQPFTAVISDLGRPGDRQAGFTLLEWLRRNEMPTPYFLYTSRRAAQLAPLAAAKGAQGMTSDPDVLVGMVLATTRMASIG